MTGLLHYRELLWNLVGAELKVKYRGSALGFLWSLLNPLALIIVYSVAFQYLLRIQLEHFSVFLIAGLLPWSFFAGSAMASTISLMVNAGLLKQVHFPRVVLPAATVLFNLVQMLLALVVFLPSVLVLRGVVPWTLVYYPLVLVLQIAFVTGVALALSALTVTFRDLRHLTEVTLSFLFWLTPVIYHVSMIPSEWQTALGFNPMTAYVSAFQEITYWGRPLSAPAIATMLGWAAASLLVGWTLFQRRAPSLAEDL
jgi:ABC-type polysaccharide/polyol phosphate export permease